MTKQAQTEMARDIVRRMYASDHFSRWLGIEIVELDVARVTLKMAVRPEMINGLSTCHGGVHYALADTALAFAANSRGRKCVALQNVISYPAPVKEGDELYATAVEVSLGTSTATYDVEIVNQHKRKVALFRGNVFRLGEEW